MFTAFAFLDDLLGQADEFGDDFSGRELLIGVPIHQLGDPLGELLGAQLVVSCGGAGFLLELAAQRIDEQRDLRGGLFVLEQVDGEILQVRNLNPGLAVDVDDTGGLSRINDQLA